MRARPATVVVWAALLALSAADLSAIAYCGVLVARSPALDIELTSNDAHCPWVGELSGSSDPGVRGAMCVRSIAGVTLGYESLVRDGNYLSSREQVARWVRDQGALHERLRGASETSLRLDGDGRVGRVVTVGVRRRPLATLLPMAAATSLTSIALVLITFLVLLRGTDRRASRTLIVFGQAVLACILPTFVYAARGLCIPGDAARWLFELNRLGYLVAALAIVYLASSFPAARFGKRTRWLGLYLPSFAAAACYVLEVAWDIHCTVPLAAFLALSSLGLFATQLRSSGQVRALQARWVIWGFSVPLAIWLGTRSPYVFMRDAADDPVDYLITITVLAIPAGIGIAILRYRLLDIEIVVRRTLLATLVTSAVLFLYSLGVSAFAGEIAEPSRGADSTGTIFITSVVLAFVLFPAQSSLEGLLDRVLFRRRHDYRAALGRLPDELVGAGTPDAAASMVLGPLCDVMGSPRAMVAMAGEDGEPRLWVGGAAALEPPDAASWAALREVESQHLGDPGPDAGALDGWLARADLDLALPMRTPDRFVGVLACAAPASRRVFSADDVATLRTVAASLALALSRTTALETIVQMNEELERRVEERTAELQEARLQLYQQEKMSSLAVLAAGVAHELNTPLGVIASATEQLVDELASAGGEPSRAARLVGLCREASERATGIVRDLSNYSRPGSQTFSLVDLDAAIESTLRLLGPMLRQRRVRASAGRGEGPSTIEGHPVMINQLLTNLVVNAAHAIGQDGGQDGEIRVRTESAEEGWIRIVVEDDGPGLDPGLRNRIFEPFFTTKAPGEGTGLGLSLCYAYVEEHGGRIREEGEAGAGARFVVELPISPPAEARARLRRTGAPPPGPTPSSPQTSE